ncbi:MAG TPA: GDSL-type esterase/lipase family protein [Blastocatellia bacterium]|nr:GDSL-type esterase/lipase family protein [Blastocatellia bacterium]
MIETRRQTPNISRWFVCLALSLFLSHGAASARLVSRETQPIEDPSGQAMLGFYESLARASQGEWVTRVLHYGDSHVAADILTGALRRQLQLWFGEAGAGFVLPGRPWPGYSRTGVTSYTSAGWQTDGLTQASLAADGRLGLAGVSFSTKAPGEWISVTAAGSYFDIYVLKQPGGGSIDVLLDGVEQRRNVSLASRASESACIEVVADTGSVHTIEIRTTSAGRARIFGIAIEFNRAGVIYDALGINGARASRPLRWDWKVLAGSLERRDPDLIVVSYGSNEVSDSDLDLEEYRASFTTLLKKFHEAAPRASILVVGPPDRAVRIANRWKSIARMPALVEAQRQGAFEVGAAFYDLFKAMGGPGSIQRWATEPELLAQPDRVHLKTAGYRLVADWLYAELMSGYLQTVSEARSTLPRQGYVQ